MMDYECLTHTENETKSLGFRACVNLITVLPAFVVLFVRNIADECCRCSLKALRKMERGFGRTEVIFIMSALRWQLR